MIWVILFLMADLVHGTVYNQICTQDSDCLYSICMDGYCGCTTHSDCNTGLCLDKTSHDDTSYDLIEPYGTSAVVAGSTQGRLLFDSGEYQFVKAAKVSDMSSVTIGSDKWLVVAYENKDVVVLKNGFETELSFQVDNKVTLLKAFDKNGLHITWSDTQHKIWVWNRVVKIELNNEPSSEPECSGKAESECTDDCIWGTYFMGDATCVPKRSFEYRHTSTVRGLDVLADGRIVSASDEFLEGGKHKSYCRDEMITVGRYSRVSTSLRIWSNKYDGEHKKILDNIDYSAIFSSPFCQDSTLYAWDKIHAIYGIAVAGDRVVVVWGIEGDWNDEYTIMTKINPDISADRINSLYEQTYRYLKQGRAQGARLQSFGNIVMFSDDTSTYYGNLKGYYKLLGTNAESLYDSQGYGQVEYFPDRYENYEDSTIVFSEIGDTGFISDHNSDTETNVHVVRNFVALEIKVEGNSVHLYNRDGIVDVDLSIGSDITPTLQPLTISKLEIETSGSGICRIESRCGDNTKNGYETDVDCGGLQGVAGECPRCIGDKLCSSKTDCAQGDCVNGKCHSCKDLVRSGNETDIDCGGDCPNKCADLKDCNENDDCVNNACFDSKCRSCNDETKNGDETDVDCGGVCGSTCTAGKECGVFDNACASNFCFGGSCIDCSDGYRNGDETDVDCGGSLLCDHTQRCVDGNRCILDSDCDSFSRCVRSKCLNYTAVGGSCSSNSECITDLCFGNLCRECSDDSHCKLGDICGNYECCQESEGNHFCDECPAGKYDHDLNAKTACENCPQGYYQDQTGQTLCKLCVSGKKASPGQSECSNILYCKEDNFILPEVPNKCVNSECIEKDGGYSCGDCTDLETWTSYKRHVLTGTNVEIEDDHVTCDSIHILDEKETEEECRQACWDSECDGYTFESTASCADGQMCDHVKSDIYLGSTEYSNISPKRMGEYYVFGVESGGSLRVVYTDLSFVTQGAKDISGVASLSALTQATFDSTSDRRRTGNRYSSGIGNSYLWQVEPKTYNVVGYGTLVGSSCRGPSYTSCTNVRYSTGMCDYSTLYASGTYCLGKITTVYSDQVHKLRTDGVVAADFYVDEVKYEFGEVIEFAPNYYAVDRDKYITKVIGDMIFFLIRQPLWATYDQLKILGVNTTSGVSEGKARGGSYTAERIMAEWDMDDWNSASSTDAKFALDFNVCQGYKGCGIETGPVKKLKRVQVAITHAAFVSKWSGEFCQIHEDCTASQVRLGDECVDCNKSPFGNVACLSGTPCEVNPCNGGSCVEWLTDYQCICPSGTYGSMCQFEESPLCIHGNILGGVCECEDKYYGDMCEYNVLCPSGSHKTLGGCLDVPSCPQDVSEPCLCGDKILRDGHCVNDMYVETCVLGAKNCYHEGEICKFFNGDSCVDYFLAGCDSPLYEEYDDVILTPTLNTCKTPKYDSLSVTTIPCEQNSDCEYGCIFGFCGILECPIRNYWNGTACVEYSACDPGTGGTPTGYADVVCSPCQADQWTNYYVCSNFSDMTECEGYWEHGNTSKDRVCYGLIECDKDQFTIHVQDEDECVLCDGYSVRDNETNKELCTPFTECPNTQYATITDIEGDVTCVDRTVCGGLEELRTSSRFSDSICLGSDVPQCVKLGVGNDHVTIQSKRDLITNGWLSKENAEIAMIHCNDGQEFTYSANRSLSVKLVKGGLDQTHVNTLVVYYRNATVDKVTPTGPFADCTMYDICLDEFEDHPIGCLHGTVNGSECIGCIEGVSGDRCDQVAQCDACEHGSCYGDIFGCSCYEGAEGLFCKDIDDCGDCEYGECVDGNGTYTCTCESFATLVESEAGHYCSFDCENCLHCESCDENGPVCSPGWQGGSCDICGTGYEVVGDNCTICDVGTFDSDSDSSTACANCPSGWTSDGGTIDCEQFNCVYASGYDVTGCICLDGWSGRNCSVCVDGETVGLIGGGTGICKDNAHICPVGKKGDNCDECDGEGCGTSVVERLKSLIERNVDSDVETLSSNKRSKAWGRASSAKVIRQRKKELLAQFLSAENEVILTPSDRDTSGVCSMSVRSDCATTTRNVRVVPVKRFSKKDEERCDVILSEFSIVFGLVDDGDQMTVCDADNNILFHQKLIDAENGAYDISFYNRNRYSKPERFHENDTFDFKGISFTVANLEAVIDPCLQNTCSELEACRVVGETFECYLACSENPCDHGECENTAGGGFSCDCTDTGYEGTTCGTLVDSCTNHDCQYGSKCVDEVGSFSCNCTGTGYDGDKCENNINDCKIDSCTNGTCVDGVNSFTCDCYDGHEGPECNDIIDCVDCMNGGSCNEGNQSFTCDCADGWEKDSDGLCTVDKNECDPNPCQNNGGCTHGINTFTCDCTNTDFEKDSDGLCTVPRDPCDSLDCAPGSCVEGVCNCTGTGFRADEVTGKCTVDINFCEVNPCVNGDCNDEALRYTCSCHLGYTKDSDGHCTVNPDNCPENACEHGSCNDGLDDYACDCDDGFSTAEDGHSCVCGLGKGYNSTSGKCESCAIPSYNLVYTHDEPCIDQECSEGYGVVLEGWNASEEGRCAECPSGWVSPLGNTPCVDDNECDRNICNGHGACDNTPGGFTCDCHDGYEGTTCNAVDYCHTNPCANNASCSNTPTKAECICTDGWEGDFCSESKDDCVDHDCIHGTCVDGHNTFTCECYPGYNGTQCQTNIDDCGGHECSPGKCVDGNGTYTCNCTNTGFVGEFCDVECSVSTCIHGTCTDEGCVCYPGWEGSDCNTDKNECASDPCKNGASCTPGNGTFECACVHPFNGTTCNECPPGYGWDGSTCSECPVGTTNDLSTLSPCVNHTCPSGFGVDLTNWSPDHREEGLCIQCEEGYESPEGHGVCENIDECDTIPYPCSGSGLCTDTEGSYNCTCNDGYSGERCEVNVNNCEGDPCGGGECIDKEGYYECNCVNGFTGTTFCVDVDECTPAGETIVVTVEGGKYVINGEEALPLSLKLGETYTFMHPESHPFRVKSSESDLGQIVSNTKYVLTITEDAELEYYCRLHTGMGNVVNIVPFLCHNNAECVNTHGDYKCECPDGYVGKNCETPIEVFCSTASATDYIDYQCCDLDLC